MAFYRVEFKPSAERELRRLPKAVIPKISRAIDSLVNNPFPHQCEKLSGSTNAYRLRVGDYRVVYVVENRILLVTIIRLGHRKDVYRRLS